MIQLFLYFLFLSDSLISNVREIMSPTIWCDLPLLDLCEGSFKKNRIEFRSEFNFKIFLPLWSVTFPHLRSGCSFTSDKVYGSNIYLLPMFLDCCSENTVVTFTFEIISSIFPSILEIVVFVSFSNMTSAHLNEQGASNGYFNKINILKKKKEETAKPPHFRSVFSTRHFDFNSHN